MGLGAPVFVPIVTIIGSIMVGMKIKDAISSGITLGVAFTGMSPFISFMKDRVTPAAQAIIISTGISLLIVDGGWNIMATISWVWPYTFLMFPLLIAVSIVMMFLNKANTINADLWGIWLKMFTTTAVISIIHSTILASTIVAAQIILKLKSSNTYQHQIEKLIGTPGVSVTHATLFSGAILHPTALVLKKVPGLNREFDTDMLKNKAGTFVGNHVMGFILGCLLGILAKYSPAQTPTTGIKATAAMMLFPVVAKYFMQILSPISEAVSAFMNKKFKGKTLIAGLDWSILDDYNGVWLAILWSIPFMLIYSMVLLGNEILPFAGLMSASLTLPTFLVTGENLLQMFILCAIGAPVFLWIGVTLAPFMTELAIAIGSTDLQAGELINNSLINGPIFTHSIFHLFTLPKDNFIPLIISAVWPAGPVLYYRDLIRGVREDAALEAGNAKAGQ